MRGARRIGWGAAGAAASSLLCRLALPPYDLWPLGLVCWLPWLLVVAGATWQRALVLGWVYGILVHLLCLGWLLPALLSAPGLGIPGAVFLFLLVVVVQGGRSAVLALLVARAVARGWPLWLVFPAALTACELVYPLVFPWHAATFVGAAPRLIQLAEWGGPLIVSAFTAVVNAGLATSALRYLEDRPKSPSRRARILVSGGGALGVLAAVALAGTCRMQQVTAAIGVAPKARMGMVQASPVPSHRHQRDPVEAYRRSTLELLTTAPHLDLVVWPEAAVSFPTADDSLKGAFRDHILGDRREGPLGARITVPLLTGMVLTKSEGTPLKRAARARPPSSPRRTVNAAVLAAPSGAVLGVYAKRILMPLGETAVFGDRLRDLGWFEPVTRFSRGDSDGLLLLGRRPISASICYEDIHPGLIRESVHNTQPELLVNLTSDAWFSGSAASELHLALARLRAVEHRRFLVRATTSGVTSVIDPVGRVTWRLPVDRVALGSAGVRWMREETLYAQAGDAPWVAAAVLALACALLRAPARRRRR